MASFPIIAADVGIEYSTVRHISLNRVYPGEVRLGDDWFPGLHEVLVDPSLFNASYRGHTKGQRRSRDLLGPCPLWTMRQSGGGTPNSGDTLRSRAAPRVAADRWCRRPDVTDLPSRCLSRAVIAKQSFTFSNWRIRQSSGRHRICVEERSSV